MLLLIKPDGVDRSITGLIIALVEQKAGYHFRKARRIQMNDDQARELYAEHRDKDFYGALCDYMTSGPCDLLYFDGTQDRAIVDAIRTLFAIDFRRNTVHAPRTVQDKAREHLILSQCDDV
jgi:nucleoside-diphosphate kinase